MTDPSPADKPTPAEPSAPDASAGAAPAQAGVTSELSRELTLFHLTAMGLGMMIGAGVFIGIGISMGLAGPGGVAMTFALNGVVALFTALSFAELSSAIPRAGGAYNFARIAFGRGTSFIAGWMEWFASSVAGSLYAVVFATYTLDYLLNGVLALEVPDERLLIYIKLTALVVAGVFIYINYRGASETGKIGALFTVGQMAFMVLIAIVGIVTSIRHPDRLSNFQPFLADEGWANLLVTMGFIYVAFEGYEVIAQAGDEAIDPRRNIPKAMLYSVLIVTVTYVLVTFAAVVGVEPSHPELGGQAPWEWIGSQGPDGDGEKGFGAAMRHLLPFGGGFLVTLAVIFSSTSALNATIYSATRASYALGRDSMLPAAFSRISPTRKTPYVALAGTAVIVLLVAGLLPTKDVASCASMMFLFLFFLVNFCAIRIRTHMADEMQYGFLMPLFPLFPILAIVCQGLMAVNIGHTSRIAWFVAPLWVVAGALVYVLYSHSRTVATEDEIRVVEEEKPPEAAEAEAETRYRVMVAVANPENALQLVRSTYALCGAKNAQVELLHMISVPEQVPLDDADRFMLEGKEGIVEAMLYLGPLFPIGTTIRYCRSIARGIVSAVVQKKADLLIMGWHGRGTKGPFSIGSTIDPIIERAPCDVAILKNCGKQTHYRRVLVPLGGGPNGGLALEMAGILCDPEEGELTALNVKTSAGRRAPIDVWQYVAQHRERIAVPDGRLHVDTMTSDDIIGAIVEKSADYDLVVPVHPPDGAGRGGASAGEASGGGEGESGVDVVD